jgi:ADP-ribose pyrophosphatase YjhB (NUDIX family)
VRRELKEETGLDVEPLRVIGVFERILLSQRGSPRLRRVRYHYVLIDYVCRLAGAPRARQGLQRLRPASDVTEARWVPPEKLRAYHLTAQAHAVILEALQWLSADG